MIKNNGLNKFFYRMSAIVFAAIMISGCQNGEDVAADSASGVTGDKIASDSMENAIPADIFDLSHWTLTVPMDADHDGKVDVVGVKALQHYRQPDYFYLDSSGNLVFTSPNKAATTANSTNTRSELRELVSPSVSSSSSPKNNFVIAAHKNAKSFGAIGGKMHAELKVNHVAVSAADPSKAPAFSVVVGQIHAEKQPALVASSNNLFGWGNEPLKIYFKKWPNQDKGSVFWTNERNLAKNDPNRIDVAYPVWGNTWENPKAPGEQGIALGEPFSYTVKVEGNIMHLSFKAKGHPEVNYKLDLSSNINAYGKVDALNNPQGYSGDALYFKAGAYNQCSVQNHSGFWYPGCRGTGDWSVDHRNGDYASVSFSVLKLN